MRVQRVLSRIMTLLTMIAISRGFQGFHVCRRSAFPSQEAWRITVSFSSSSSSSSQDTDQTTSTSTSSPVDTPTSTTASANNSSGKAIRLNPWNRPDVPKKKNNRFRQHINPLASLYQQPTVLSNDWPHDTLDDCDTRPLHLDIGCGKGGFLIDLANHESSSAAPGDPQPLSQEEESSLTDTRGVAYNYLGLEIRPSVAVYARERIDRHGLTGRLDYLGCNANVDLPRLLQRYPGPLQRVSIQYPDPHFKKQHAKRRVVTSALVGDLARFMATDGIVFLQSDIQTVLDDMRERFRDYGKAYFVDSVDSVEKYLPENILGVPTERETSVLVKGLPTYRSLFTRNDTPYAEPDSEQEQSD